MATSDMNELRILAERGFRGVTLPVTMTIPGTSAATAANWTTPFFRAQRSYLLIGVWERHETAAGAGVTVMLKKCASGIAPAAGTDMLSSGIDLNAANDTDQSGSIVGTSARRLVDGDSLCLSLTGSVAGMTGVTLTVLLKAI